MKTITNILLFLSLVSILPGTTSFASDEMWTAWADYNQDGNPIYLGHYQEGKWTKKLFEKSMLFEDCYSPCPGIDPEGRLWLVWVARQNSEDPGLYWSLQQNGEWTNPLRVVPGSNEWEYAPALAFDPEGNPHLAWSQVYGESTEIFSAGWQGNFFGTPEMVSSPDESPDSDPAVGFGKNGEAIIVWQGVENGYARIFESRRVGGEWTAEESVDPEARIDQVRPAIRCRNGRDQVISWDQANQRVLLTGTGEGKLSLRNSSPILFSEVNGPDSLHSIWMLRKTPEGTWASYRVQPRLKFDKPAGRRTELRGADGDEYYIGYGDSITYGHDYGNDSSGWYGPLLKTMLESSRPGLTCNFYNKGYPGALTSELLYGGGAEPYWCPGINSILSDYSWATYILIMGGTNDIKTATPLVDISYNLGEMISRTNSTSIEPVLSTIIPRVNKISNFTRSTNLSIDYIPPLASSMGCLLADPFSVFMQYYPSDYFWEDLYGYPTAYYDGTHPYWPQGDDKIAEAWFAALVTPTPTPAILIIDSDDYNGDSTSDISVFRSAAGLWAIKDITRVYFGNQEDIPIAGDYNNNGVTDIGIFRESNGLWAIRGVTRVYFGGSSDRAAPGDYNGDGFCDIAIFRESTGLWAVQDITRCYFGAGEDIAIPGYYQGLRKKDIAIFRPSSGLWVCRSFTHFYFGSADDRPAVADYDGDGSEEFAIFRSNSNLWAIRGYSRIYYGTTSDIPVAAPYGGGAAVAAIFRESSGLWALRGLSHIYYGAENDIPLNGRIPRPVTPSPTPSPTTTSSSTPNKTPTPTP